MPAIVARGLTKSYGVSMALDDVDLVVDAGEVRGLLGPNGAGKTTLLRILFGLVRPDSGTVELLGRPQAPDRISLDGVAGFVEDPRFYPHMSARVNLEALVMLDGEQVRPEHIDEALELVGLADRREDRVGGFSTGMRQRLGIAAALLRRPRLLMLDEPTASLDPSGIKEIGSMIRELAARGVAVLVSSHQIAEVESVCDSFTILRRGVAVWTGGADELRAQASGSGYRLVTNDDERALALAASHARVEATRAGRGDVVLVADQPALDEFVLALAEQRIALRRLELLVSPLESMFFELTREGAQDAMTLQELADHALQVTT